MCDPERLAFHGDYAHPEAVVDDLHVDPIHPYHLTKWPIGLSGQRLGPDLQNLRHAGVPFRCDSCTRM
jgi:hypothetical protein